MCENKSDGFWRSLRGLLKHCIPYAVEVQDGVWQDTNIRGKAEVTGDVWEGEEVMGEVWDGQE